MTGLILIPRMLLALGGCWSREVARAQHKTQQQIPPGWAGWVGWVPMVLGMGAASFLLNILLLIFVLGMDFDCTAVPPPVDSPQCPDHTQLEPSLPGIARSLVCPTRAMHGLPRKIVMLMHASDKIVRKRSQLSRVRLP